MSVNVRERTTSRRKMAFLRFDSIKVRAISGAQIFIGMPGKPAPEPRSATRANPRTAEDAEAAEKFFSVLPWSAGVGKRCLAAKRDSPKWRGASSFWAPGAG